MYPNLGYLIDSGCRGVLNGVCFKRRGLSDTELWLCALDVAVIRARVIQQGLRLLSHHGEQVKLKQRSRLQRRGRLTETLLPESAVRLMRPSKHHLVLTKDAKTIFGVRCQDRRSLLCGCGI